MRSRLVGSLLLFLLAINHVSGQGLYSAGGLHGSPGARYQPTQYTAPARVPRQQPVVQTQATSVVQQQVVVKQPAPIVHQPVVATHAAPIGNPSCNACPISMFFFGEYLYLAPRGVDLPFGQIRDGFGAAAVPTGRTGVADADYSHGLRIGGGARLDCKTFIQGSYSWYESSTESNLRATTNNVIVPLIIFPNTIPFAPTSEEATANIDIDFHVADIELRRLVYGCDWCQISYLIGGRYARLQQDMESLFDVLGGTEVDTSIDFNGGGIKVGLDGEFGHECGLFVHTSGSLSLLLGQFDADYLQRNAFAGTQAQTDYSDERILPILDLRIGAGWSGNHVRLMAGYQASMWFNTMTTPTWIEGVQDSNLTTNGDNLRNTLSFDGFFGQIEFRY